MPSWILSADPSKEAEELPPRLDADMLVAVLACVVLAAWLAAAAEKIRMLFQHPTGSKGDIAAIAELAE